MELVSAEKVAKTVRKNVLAIVPSLETTVAFQEVLYKVPGRELVEPGTFEPHKLQVKPESPRKEVKKS